MLVLGINHTFMRVNIMEKEYYVEFNHRVIKDNVSYDYSTKSDYDYIWAESEEDAKDIIREIYGMVDITLVELYIV